LVCLHFRTHPPQRFNERHAILTDFAGIAVQSWEVLAPISAGLSSLLP
jgi:hypothetical protein